MCTYRFVGTTMPPGPLSHCRPNKHCTLFMSDRKGRTDSLSEDMLHHASLAESRLHPYSPGAVLILGRALPASSIRFPYVGKGLFSV